MSYSIVTDTSANLPNELLVQQGVSVVPFSYYVEGEECTCEDTAAFDGAGYYNAIRTGTRVTTSQINPQRYIDCLRPLLEAGQDILYVGMSSGISGSYASAELAAQELQPAFPARSIRLVDTYSASLGEGLLVIKAAACRAQGMELNEVAALLLSLRGRMCQVFTVDDLMHLRRSGRISNITAVAGTVLKIKPLLKGDELGRIVNFGKVIGRRRAVEALAARYEALVELPEAQTGGIAHAGCPE
ncbi:MAG: DegV family protein, partial [Eubacteriales bacterium]|nr:DegV family protein [Eubacteriales bacterium]